MAANIKIGVLQKSLSKGEKETFFKTSKELVLKMESLGFPKEKGHNDSIDEREFNILFASLADNYSTEVDIKSYIEGAAIVPGHGRDSGATEKTEAKPAAPKVAVPKTAKAEPKPEAKTEKPAVKPAEKVKPADNAKNGAVQSKPEAAKKPVADNKPKADKVEKTETKPVVQNKPVTDNKPKTEPVKQNKPEVPVAPKQPVAPKTEQVSKPDVVVKAEPAKKQENVQKPVEQPKKDITITTGKKTQQQSQRSFTAPDFTKNNKVDQKKQDQRKPQPVQQQGQPQQKPKGGIDISANNGGSIRNTNGKARVVDTRGSGAVDLSKYDEKFEKFASDRNLSDTRGGRVSDGRTKKVGKFDKEKDKERLELERARRQQGSGVGHSYKLR